MSAFSTECMRERREKQKRERGRKLIQKYGTGLRDPYRRYKIRNTVLAESGLEYPRVHKHLYKGKKGGKNRNDVRWRLWRINDNTEMAIVAIVRLANK